MVKKIFTNRLPLSVEDLASQPTISRIENTVITRDLYKMDRELLDFFVTSYPSNSCVVIIDCNDTNNNTYGKQVCLFNSYYHNHCCMPLYIYEGAAKAITKLTITSNLKTSINTPV